MLTKSVLRTKNEQILILLGDYFLEAGHHFYPFTITQHNYKKLDAFIKIAKYGKYRTPK